MKRYLLLPLLAACLLGSWLGAQEEVRPVILRPDVPRLEAAPLPASPAETAKPAAARGEPQLPPEAHPWGRFPLGSWKSVRVTSETLDANGKSTGNSVTETKTTLIEASDHDYSLQVEVTVQVEGKRFARPPQVARLSYWGDLSESPTGVRKVGTAEVELNGKSMPCEIRQVVTEQQGERRQSVVYYCDTSFPYVLKRESIVTLTAAEAKPQTTRVEVIATNLPYRILGQLRSVAYVKTTRKLASGSTLTMEVQSPDVPGGVVSHSAQELDDAQVVNRRSTLELIDYGVGSEPVEEASPARKRWFRSRSRRGEEMAPPRR
ncbi:hypothetical protein ETAA8_63260 [Anatilimnocola aggregata]|uniref:Uncharacterized protein n=1 Tax=Anatilimnocola aggregata TaxID=2528021 RepID=A0A517YLS7_9BACT|nr:hypothetical protein [Anatilimnocola aggregata]QDU31173.1 hypothetical protein ETAA8_63260 [Anatilimnocola aggregata]